MDFLSKKYLNLNKKQTKKQQQQQKLLYTGGKQIHQGTAKYLLESNSECQMITDLITRRPKLVLFPIFFPVRLLLHYAV